MFGFGKAAKKAREQEARLKQAMVQPMYDMLNVLEKMSKDMKGDRREDVVVSLASARAKLNQINDTLYEIH